MTEKTKAWGWVSLAFFGEGLPYAVINILLLAMMADLEVGNGIAVLLTSVIALPWSLKALWSPVVEAYGTKKKWMLWLMSLNTLLMLLIAWLLSGNLYLLAGIALAAAIIAATYDVACDGHYLRVLSPTLQAYFVGIRTTTYRIGLLLASGGLVALCGWFMKPTIEGGCGISIATSWSITFCIIGILFGLISLLLQWILPQDSKNTQVVSNPTDGGQTPSLYAAYRDAIRAFFARPVGKLLFMFAFLFFYRMGESLLSKVTILFLKADLAEGGLALTNEAYGMLYGTCGVLTLIAGGIAGGICISRYGLRRCIIPMVLCLNLPDLLYVWLSIAQPSSLWIIGSCISIEQLGYGFGLAAYTVYLMDCAKGEFETAHYAFLTAIMIMSLLLPSMISGYLQQSLGYTNFFWFACAASIPGLILSLILFRNRR